MYVHLSYTHTYTHIHIAVKCCKDADLHTVTGIHKIKIVHLHSKKKHPIYS